jgi:DNA-binding transcriptional MerR regulator
MKLKMKDLVERTNTPKSTILYYIKEGLLPQPKKPKPNVHIYDERFIYMIEFIKYLQKNFDASIEQIKQIITSKNFDFSKGYENLIENLDILMFATNKKRYLKEDLCKKVKIDCETLEDLISKGLILDREGGFIETDLESLRIIKELLLLDGGKELLHYYIESAKVLSQVESQFALNLLKRSKDKNRSSKILLDTALILKPYIFNSMLFKSFKKMREEDEKATKN